VRPRFRTDARTDRTEQARERLGRRRRRRAGVRAALGRNEIDVLVHEAHPGETTQPVEAQALCKRRVADDSQYKYVCAATPELA